MRAAGQGTLMTLKGDATSMTCTLVTKAGTNQSKLVYGQESDMTTPTGLKYKVKINFCN